MGRQQHHGMKPIRGLNREEGMVPDQAGGPQDGGFGRLFNKDPQQPGEQELVDLGKKDGPMDEGAGTPAADNPDLPLGFVFFGQFVDHDITLDEESSLDHPEDPDAVINLRTPSLELDSVYGGGPDNDSSDPDRKMYDSDDPAKLRVGTPDNPDDLPRIPPGSEDAGRALIGDPRNDENLVINQLQVAFLEFHNAAVDHVRAGGTSNGAFAEAQRLVRWHYQWIVLHEFLPRIVGQDLVDDILQNGRKHYKVQPNRETFIPVEFSVAAYRYGHSQVRARIHVNSQVQDVPLFSDEMPGFQPVPPDKVIDWSHYFERSGATSVQPSRKIDGKLPGVLFDLPFLPPDIPAEHRSLAVRNLLRGRTFELISGQHAARRMQATLLTDEQLGVEGSGLADRTPLWFYILKEAEVQQDGRKLGEVGGRIVAEVLIGLLQEDSESYLNVDPDFTPTLPGATPGQFTMVDLLDFAGV